MSSKSNDSRSRAAALLIAAALVLASTSAGADTVFAVTRLRGKNLDTLQRQLEELVAERWRLAPRRRTERLYRKKTYQRDLAKLARRLEADVVLTGKVTRLRRSKRYRLYIDATTSSGEVLDTFRLKLKSKSLRPSDERRVMRQLERIAEQTTGDDEPVFSPQEESGTNGDDFDETVLESSSDESDNDEHDWDVEVKREPSGNRSDSSGHAPMLRIGAGLTVAARNFDFDYGGAPAAAPQGYAGSPFIGVRLHGTVFPFSRERKGSMRWFGLGVEYERMLFIKSRVAGTDVDLPTSSQGWLASALYRRPLSEGVSATIAAIVHHSSFSLDRSQLPATIIIDVASVRYTALGPGAQLAIAASDATTVRIAIDLFLLLSSGEIGEQDLYGKRNSFGGGAQLVLDHHVGDGLFVELRAAARLYRLGFSGSGALTDRDGDGNQDVNGATDRFISGLLGAGYRY